MMSKAGEFEIDVSPPHPWWSLICHNGEEIASIHHKELSDLKYAVEKAMQEARSYLKRSGEDGEV